MISHRSLWDLVQSQISASHALYSSHCLLNAWISVQWPRSIAGFWTTRSDAQWLWFLRFRRMIVHANDCAKWHCRELSSACESSIHEIWPIDCLITRLIGCFSTRSIGWLMFDKQLSHRGEDCDLFANAGMLIDWHERLSAWFFAWLFICVAARLADWRLACWAAFSARIRLIFAVFIVIVVNDCLISARLLQWLEKQSLIWAYRSCAKWRVDVIVCWHAVISANMDACICKISDIGFDRLMTGWIDGWCRWLVGGESFGSSSSQSLSRWICFDGAVTNDSDESITITQSDLTTYNHSPLAYKAQLATTWFLLELNRLVIDEFDQRVSIKRGWWESVRVGEKYGDSDEYETWYLRRI